MKKNSQGKQKGRKGVASRLLRRGPLESMMPGIVTMLTIRMMMTMIAAVTMTAMMTTMMTPMMTTMMTALMTRVIVDALMLYRESEVES